MDIDLSVLKLMESEREIPFDELVVIIEQAILVAYEKHTGQADHRGMRENPDAPRARVEIDKKTGHVVVYIPIVNEEGEKTGEEVDSPEDFGRIAAHAAKQVINQRLRDIGDDRILGEYRGKDGDIVSGIIAQGPNPRMIHVNLGEVEAILPPEEQVPGEVYEHGARIRVYVTKVDKGLKGPSITVSRTHPGLVRKLFAMEVPEIHRGLVDITSIAREAGHRTKIAVKALEPGINAKGACIGELGQRVRAVQAELGEEKIDIVDHSDDLAQFVSNALSPAKVTSAFVLDEEARQVRALVPDYQLSLAIGKEGQNARLAAKLTGAKIDIQPDSVMDS
ncbi:MAG: transcription termination/antitermination protein NusA [Microbacteriaceae bacterium]|jgi:transcription termination/antitermination protein NusA|nr:transcription termination/antitermination protein NusA [Microbacteriaceae bacterium]MBT5730310.1 transcription termination/antitermination protein NusA [Microbacteriaceae bacterium]